MKKLRILSYNILKGGVGRESLIAGVISAQLPDVVILQEAYRPEVDTAARGNLRFRAFRVVARSLRRVHEPY